MANERSDRDLPLDAPEADVIEQSQPVGDEAEPPAVKEIPPDVPEADALEQSQTVEIDDDRDR